MNYKAAILNSAPDYWERNQTGQVPLSNLSQELKQISFEVGHALGNPNIQLRSITRVQNVHDLGQCLVREQLLLTAKPHSKFYRVRRFISVDSRFLNNALTYNLDHRRCGLNDLVFWASNPNISSAQVLLAVQVITENPHLSQVKPNNNLEYFIDYVIYL